MVGRRRKSSRPLAASHQRSWLWGRHAVIEMLTAARWSPLEVRISERLDPDLVTLVTAECERRAIPLSEHPAEQLTRWCTTGEHQGLLALMPPYPYVALEQLLAQLPRNPLLMILDRLQDPHNFGAILRSADVFGAHAVFVGCRSQSEVTPHVARSSAGAVSHLPICRVDDIAALPGLLRSRLGVQTCAAMGGAAVSVAETDLRGPLALVIGNEGSGVDPGLAAACDRAVRIPQSGHVESLNAAVAAGVLLYEASRQRGFGADAPAG